MVRFDAERTAVRQILEEELSRATMPERDKAFCRDLVNGALRRLNGVDWALDRFARPPVARQDKLVRAALRLGAYQLLYETERVPAYAAVSQSVDLVKGRGGPGRGVFVNAVLRSLERGKGALPWPDPEAADPVRALAILESHPEWLVERWVRRFGAAEARALLRRNNEKPPLTARVNTLRGARERLSARLGAEGVRAEPSAVSPDGLRLTEASSFTDLPSFRDGLFMLQDEASQWVTLILDPRPGETIVDLCAAPGGKSTHIAQRLENRGRVIALDANPGKLELLKQNAARLGASIVEPLALDAREAGGRFGGAADRVLVDAPCSSLGIARRRPDIRWTKTLKTVTEELPPLQREILESASRCLKPGGVLVYSTCTMEPEENERVLDGFLAEHPEFQVESAAPLLPEPLRDIVTPEGYVRFLPHKHDTDGFFIARLKKEKA